MKSQTPRRSTRTGRRTPWTPIFDSRKRKGDILVGDTPAWSGYQATILADGPVFYMPLDEASGNMQDISGNANHAVITNCTRNAIGLAAGGSASFNGAQDVRLGSAPAVLNIEADGDFTYELWFERADSNYFGGMFIKRQNGSPFSQVGISCGTISGAGAEVPSKRLTFAWFDGTNRRTWTTDTDVVDGGRHHVLMGMTGGTTPFCIVDGAAVGLTLGYSLNSFPAANIAHPVYIGWNGSASTFVGELDECAIYDYALTTTEAAAHIAAKEIP